MSEACFHVAPSRRRLPQEAAEVRCGAQRLVLVGAARIYSHGSPSLYRRGMDRQGQALAKDRTRLRRSQIVIRHELIEHFALALFRQSEVTQRVIGRRRLQQTSQ